jgi:hypothetical protein
VYIDKPGTDCDDDQTQYLLHELSNDLAAIEMRADILIGMDSMSGVPMSALVRSDLVTVRSTAEHAITTIEHLAAIINRAARPAIEGPGA